MIPDDLLPEKYRDQAFIAGGFAACPSLANDMDVWVMAPCPFTNETGADDLRVLVHLHAVRKELLAHLHAHHPHYAITEEITTRTVKDEDLDERYGSSLDHITIKVAKIFHRPPIQLLVTSAAHVGAVLAAFDISTHQVAITPQGVVRGSSWTPITTEPMVINDKPHTTNPERLKKITERYKHVNS